jgi:hypothetical protein
MSFLSHFTCPTLIRVALSHAWRDVVRLVCACRAFSTALGCQEYWRVALPHVLRARHPELNAKLRVHIDQFYVIPDWVPHMPRPFGPWWMFMYSLLNKGSTVWCEAASRFTMNYLKLSFYELHFILAPDTGIVSVVFRCQISLETYELTIGEKPPGHEQYSVWRSNSVIWMDAMHECGMRWRGTVIKRKADDTKYDPMDGYFYQSSIN